MTISFHNMGVSAIRRLNLFIFLFFHISNTECRDMFTTYKYEVHIFSWLPDNTDLLEFRCQSKDDDLGYHKLHVGEGYYWKFKDNFFGNTLFFCHFYWQKKEKVFDVFNKDIECNIVAFGTTHKCYWLVKADGFYLSNYKANPTSPDWKKLESW